MKMGGHHDHIILLSVLSVLLSAVTVPLSGEEFIPTYNPTLTVSSPESSFIIDGRLDDAGWINAARISKFHEHFPGDQVRPPVETEVLMTYDDYHLYIAFICHDEPHQVRNYFGVRDNPGGADNVIVMIDTYNDGAWAYEFGATPNGIQWDALWSREGGRDRSYDMIYYSNGMVTDSGWQVEMKIPFSSMSFPQTDQQTWRMDFLRNYPRQHHYQMSWAAYDRDNPCWPCQWGLVSGIKEVKPGKSIELLPAFFSYQSSRRAPYIDRESEWVEGDIIGEASLGLKYDISSNMTAEATINPDFSQIESGALQIDLNSPFAVFLPEHRPFFQEGSDLFSTWFDVVYTRSINDPLFAGKFIGRMNDLNIAFLSAYDESSPLLLPAEDFSTRIDGGESMSNILRVRQTFGLESHLGLLVTDRRYEDDGSGSLISLDGAWKLNKNYKIKIQAVASHTDEQDKNLLPDFYDNIYFDNGRYTLALDNESFWGHGFYTSLERMGRNIHFNIDYREKSPTLRTANGFENSNDSRLVDSRIKYVFYPESDIVAQANLWAYVERGWNHDGERKDESAQAGGGITLPGQSSVNISYLVGRENFSGYIFDGIRRFNANLNTHFIDELDIGFRLSYGKSLWRVTPATPKMSDEISIYVNATIKPLDRLFVSPSYQYTRYSDPDSNRTLSEGYYTSTRIDLQLTREFSFRLITYYSDFAKTWEFDPLLTYQVNPFTLVYLGSSHKLRDFEFFYGESKMQESTRQFFLKIQYLWQI